MARRFRFVTEIPHRRRAGRHFDLQSQNAEVKYLGARRLQTCADYEDYEAKAALSQIFRGGCRHIIRVRKLVFEKNV